MKPRTTQLYIHSVLAAGDAIRRAKEIAAAQPSEEWETPARALKGIERAIEHFIKQELRPHVDEHIPTGRLR